MASSGSLNAAWSRFLIEELRNHGVNHICIAPGSRSSPLTLAAANTEGITTTVHLDERGLAFYALGYARGSGKPAAVITTSGTAVANLFPAVVESSMDQVPLIILSADRPPELRQTSANQTIEQVNIFGNYVRWHQDLPCPDEAISPHMLLSTVSHAVARSIEPVAGPVHLNCMFREPLIPEENNTNLPDNWENINRADGSPYTIKSSPLLLPAQESITRFIDVIKNIKHGIVVVGSLRNNKERQAILEICEMIGWPTFCDITSGLRLTKSIIQVSYYDLILSSDKFTKHFQPDTVVHLGGRFVSKRLQQFIERSRPTNYLQVNQSSSRLDPGHLVSEHIRCHLDSFYHALQSNDFVTDAPIAKSPWHQASSMAENELDKLLDMNGNLNEPAAVRLISRILPDNGALFLASSMPIRAADMYAATEKNIYAVAANRGASGIDGTLASAAGYANGIGKTVTCLIGDLALLHDFNSLLLLKGSVQKVVVIVFNNNGGQIFNLLSVSKLKDTFEKYFVTPHDLKFEQAAAMFAMPYNNVTTLSDLEKAYTQALSRSESSLIEISLDPKRDYSMHKKVLQQIAAAVDDI